MAELSTEDRQRIWRAIMRYWSREFGHVLPIKPIILTTINETDSWIDTEQSSYLDALTYRESFTGAELALMFCVVAALRTGQIELVRRMLGVNTEA